MSDAGLEGLIGKREETTAEKVRKAMLSRDAPFEEIYGIKDVKENLMDALEQASFISRQGYIPILLLVGPSGSGKTELINSMLHSYKIYARENEIFTLSIDGHQCVYNENPYNLYRSVIPKDIKISTENLDTKKFLMNQKRPEICHQCEQNLEKILDASKNIRLERIYPESSIVEFGDSFLSPSFVNVLKNSNRSILTISADKIKLGEINPRIFQLMSNVYDNNLSDPVGNRIPLDSMVIIHSNESFMETLAKDKPQEFKPLLDRIIKVNVRRNLSYSEEVKIIEEYNLPMKQTIPNFFEYIAKINILSRIPALGSDYEDLNQVLELLDYYDSSRLDEFERKMTQSISKFIDNTLPENDTRNSKYDVVGKKYLTDAAKMFIFSGREYQGGWSSGISIRSISNIIDFNYSGNSKNELSFSDITSYLKRNEESIEDYDLIRDYIDDVVTRNVQSDIDYAILSFYFGDHFKEYTQTIGAYFNSLINPQSREFKDSNGYLSDASRYFDIERLKTYSNEFREKVVPLGIVNYSADFKSIFNFLTFTGTDCIKRESKYDSFLGDGEIDKTTELYHYIKNFLKSNLGYFDRAIEEALKVYTRGTLMYD